MSMDIDIKSGRKLCRGMCGRYGVFISVRNNPVKLRSVAW